MNPKSSPTGADFSAASLRIPAEGFVFLFFSCPYCEMTRGHPHGKITRASGFKGTHSCQRVIRADYFVGLLSDLAEKIGREHQLILSTAVSSNENRDIFIFALPSTYLHREDFQVLPLDYK